MKEIKMKDKILVAFAILSILVMGNIFSTIGCIEKDSIDPFESNGSTDVEDTYVVDTGQNICYDDSDEISYPEFRKKYIYADREEILKI